MGSERMVRANGVELCVEAFGRAGDPVILLMGGAASSMDYWATEFCERLAAGLRYVVRYDTRDTGRSMHYPAGEPGYSGMDLAADAIGLLDVLGVDSAHLVGISMGGALAQLAALEFPDRVASLTLIATSSEGPGARDLPGITPELAAYYASLTPPDWADRAAVLDYMVAGEQALSGPEYFDEAAVRATAERVLDRTADIEASMGNHLRAGDGGAAPIRPRLGQIGVPTLVVHGTRDPLFPIEHGEALAREIPGAELLILDGVGHQAPPRATWDTVVPALLRHTSGGWPQQADRLAALSIAAGDPTGWFDQLYATAVAGEVAMPWDRRSPNPLLVDQVRPGNGGRAVVVGSGLGFDAAYLAELGYATVGFDVSETAVKLARDRSPGVDFQVADLLDLPADWTAAFDLVVEIYTVQALPRRYRRAATEAIARLVAPGGVLLAIYVRDDGSDPDEGPPWLLTREELDAYGSTGLTPVRVEELVDATDRDHWRAEFHRSSLG
jgi:pimeloyl-ACP methyl ester carboxylesterase/SAM-dependent methyltransferase